MNYKVRSSAEKMKGFVVSNYSICSGHG